MKTLSKLMFGPIVAAIGATLVLVAPPTAFAAVGAAPSIDSSITDAYTIHRSDMIDISVAGHDELKASLQVLPDGTISVPGAGTFRAAGMTADQLTKALTASFGKTINGPDVTVSLRPAQTPLGTVSVLGAVKSPGQYPVQPGTRLLDTIAAASGLVADPSLCSATLISSGGSQSQAIDVAKVFANPISSMNLVVNPGDILLVNAQDATAIQVQITGEVQKPGAFQVKKDGISVFDLIMLAGGPTKSASLKDAQIVHNGKAQGIDLRTYAADLAGSPSTTVLAPGDVLQIPAIAERYAIMGEVREPGTFDLPDGATISLRSALIRSGGTTSQADVKNASLLRSDATGKAVASTVNVADLLTGKTPDVDIQPGDVIFVPTIGNKDKFNPLTLIGLFPLLSFLKK